MYSIAKSKENELHLFNLNEYLERRYILYFDTKKHLGYYCHELNSQEGEMAESQPEMNKARSHYKEKLLDILDLLILNENGLTTFQIQEILGTVKLQTIGGNLHLLRKYGFVDRKERSGINPHVWFSCLTPKK